MTLLYRLVPRFIWRLLPDKCQVEGCCRQGVRGNENRIDGRIVCDYCHYQMIIAGRQR
jgi:hypothetical protein